MIYFYIHLFMIGLAFGMTKSWAGMNVKQLIFMLILTILFAPAIVGNAIGESFMFYLKNKYDKTDKNLEDAYKNIVMKQ